IGAVQRIAEIRLRTGAERNDGAFFDGNDLGEFFDRSRLKEFCRREAVNGQRVTFSFVPSRISSTRFPISAVLVVVCFPISVQPRGAGKILAVLRSPSGLNTRLTRNIVSRWVSLKTRSIKFFFSYPMPCSPLRDPPTSTHNFMISSLM